MRDKTDASDDAKADLHAGIEASNRVLMLANSAVDRELRAEALADLCLRVDDWKNHRVDHFGELLLHGHFPVVTGKSDVQKEVRSNSLLNDSVTYSSASPYSPELFDSSPLEFKMRKRSRRKALASNLLHSPFFSSPLLLSPLVDGQDPLGIRDPEQTGHSYLQASPLLAYSKARPTRSLEAFPSFQRATPTLQSEWDRETLLGSRETLIGSTEAFPSFDEDVFEEQPIERDEEDYFPFNTIYNHFNGVHPISGEPFLALQMADELGYSRPQYEQYTIYLFERILLCCKELNPNKSKDKLMGAQKDKKDKKDKNRNKEPNKNAKLQLKGRIFMTNVTEVLSLAKQGSFLSACTGNSLTFQVL